ncbi:transposase [Nitrosomonas communis]|uniref:transposase n=1 Tax=Nitrosomonas communis TaxID=44574 RepID=UPI003D2AC95A
MDESGFAQDAPRTHGYAPAGQRCHGTHDWHAQGRINAIGALIGKLLVTVSLFALNIDADVFYGWAMQYLLPELPSHAVVVMDNATLSVLTSQLLKFSRFELSHMLVSTISLFIKILKQ